MAAAENEKIEVRAFARKKLVRRPLPDHLPPERIVYPAGPPVSLAGGNCRIAPGERRVIEIEPVSLSRLAPEHRASQAGISPRRNRPIRLVLVWKVMRTTTVGVTTGRPNLQLIANFRSSGTCPGAFGVRKI